MRTLSRYFVARFLKLFVAILLTSMLGIATIEMLLNFEDALKAGPGSAGPLTYLLLRIPSYYLRELVPISTFAAAFGAFALAAYWLETSAAKAGGISPLRFLPPILVAASGIAATTFVINETVVVLAAQRWSELEQGDQGVVSFRQGSFWYHSGHTIYNIKEADRADRTLHGIRIYDRDHRGRLLSSLHADRVQIEDSHHWIFDEATIYYFDPDHPEAPARVEHHQNLRQEIADESEAALLAADAATLSIRTLLTYIEAQPSPDRVQRLTADLHDRLAEPFVTLVFTLMAVPLGLRVEQTRTLALPAVYGVATIGGFYLLRGTVATLASGGLLDAVLAPWLLVALFSLWALWAVVRIPR